MMEVSASIISTHSVTGPSLSSKKPYCAAGGPVLLTHRVPCLPLFLSMHFMLTSSLAHRFCRGMRWKRQDMC